MDRIRLASCSGALRRSPHCIGHSAYVQRQSWYRSSFRSGASPLAPVNRFRESARVWPRPTPQRGVPIPTPNSHLEAESAEPSPRLASGGVPTPHAVNDTAPVTLDGGR